MDVYLDNQRVQSSPDVRTLQDIIVELRPQLDAGRSMIVTILRDHRAVPDDQLEAVLNQPVQSENRVDLVSAPIADIAVEALHAAQGLLSRTRALQAQACQAFGQGQIEPAIAHLKDCIGDWSTAYDAVIKTIQLAEPPLEELHVDQTPVVNILGEVTHQLTEIRNSLLARDYVLLNDLLQYEIMPAFERWERMVGAIRQSVADAGT